MSHMSRASLGRASRSPSPTAPAPKRRATSPATRRSTYDDVSSDDEQPLAVSTGGLKRPTAYDTDSEFKTPSGTPATAATKPPAFLHTLGKSTVYLSDRRGNTEFCGAPVVGNPDKICFRPNCTVATHQKPSAPLDIGIYFRCGTSGANYHRVHRDPVGHPSVLTRFGQLFPRLEETRVSVVKTILKLMQEVTDETLLLDQLERITSVLPAPSTPTGAESFYHGCLHGY